MASSTVSAVVLVCCVLQAWTAGSRFKNSNIPDITSPYNLSDSVLHSAPPSCWCGPNSDCWLAPPLYDTKQCSCRSGYVGHPPSCRPSAELWRLCFENDPCGRYAECEVEDGARRCPYCADPAVGAPPDCAPPQGCDVTESESCGPNSVCDAHHSPRCSCARGFVGDPPHCTAGPALLALCDPYPCGADADCRVQDGGRPVCACASGYVGTAPRCAPGAELWRVCFKDAPCGPHSRCEMVDRVAVCSPCDTGYTGEPPYCSRDIGEWGLND